MPRGRPTGRRSVLASQRQRMRNLRAQNAQPAQEVQPVVGPEEPEAPTPNVDHRFDFLLRNFTPENVRHIKKFDEEVGKIAMISCQNCQRTSPGLVVNREGLCAVCRNDSVKLTGGNRMDPGEIPDELKNLTYIEEMLIALVHPVISLYRVRGAQYAYHGNVINFYQDIRGYARQLPHSLHDLDSTILFAKNTPAGLAYFKADREKLRRAIGWLRANNPYYRDVDLSEENLSQIPEDGDLTQLLSTLVVHDAPPEEPAANAADNSLDESFVPALEPTDQAERINNLLQLPYPPTDGPPINEFEEEGFIVRAFPCLFPYGEADLKQERTTALTPKEYFDYLIEYKDRRFVKDPRFRFFAMNFLMRRNALSLAGVYMNRSRAPPATVGEVQERIADDPSFLRQLMVYGAQLRSTKAYWRQRCSELLEMVETLGPSQVFFTLSAADYHWPDLYRLLAPERDPSTLTEAERRDLMHSNPDLVDYFVQQRVKLFLEKVLTPIFKVQDYWYRFEWQWRGSNHAHGLLWFQGAPDTKKKTFTDEEMATIKEYYDGLIFAINPDVDAEPAAVHPSRQRFTDVEADARVTDLIKLLNNFQRHTRCGNYCLRQQAGNPNPVCRFKFPLDLQAQSRLFLANDALEYIPLRNDPLLTKFNPIVAQSWRANTDWSPTPSLNGILQYIAKYASKGEKSSKNYTDVLNNLASRENENAPAKKVISKLLISTLGERDYSAQEVTHLLLGCPLYRCSRTFETLTISDESWQRLNVERDNQTIRAGQSLIDKYRGRPESAAALSLLEFTRKHYMKGATMHTRRKEAIVRVFPRLRLTGELENDEHYYKLKVILNHPFIGPDSQFNTLLHDSVTNITYTTWAERFESLQLEAEDPIEFPEAEDEGEAFNRVNNNVQRDPAMVQAGIELFQHEPILGRRVIDLSFDWAQYSSTYPPLETITQFLRVYKAGRPSIEVNPILNINFSQEQQAVINIFESQIHHLQTNTGFPPKLTVVQGPAGSGKSTIISHITSRAIEVFGPDSIAIAAPTGVAALNIAGKTLHTLLKLPFSFSTYKELTGRPAREMQDKLKNTRFLIIDEMSMVGARMFYFVEKRCSELRHTRKRTPSDRVIASHFGGLHVYLFGDFNQLPPVKDRAFFSNTFPFEFQAEGKLIFSQFERRIQLQQCHRQGGEDEAPFRGFLSNLAIGECTEEDYQLICSRRSFHVFCSCTDEARLANPCPKCPETESFKTAIRLFPTNVAVKNANEAFLRKTGNPIAEVSSFNQPDIWTSDKEDQDIGLVKYLTLCVGCRVMLRKNLWTEGGLVNGSLGFLRAIVYAEGGGPPALPLYVLVEFDNYEGPFIQDRCFPIIPITNTWYKGNVTHSRKQLPLTLAHASTIHKSQGLTLPKIIVDIGSKESQIGLSYVAFSRVRKLTDLVVLGVFPQTRLSGIKHHPSQVSKMAFLREYFSRG